MEIFLPYSICIFVLLQVALSLTVSTESPTIIPTTTPVAYLTINTIAGNGSSIYSGDNGPALLASIPVDAFSLQITTVTGNGNGGYGGDSGPASNGLLRSPRGVTGDSSGSIYIADTNNFRLRVISPGYSTLSPTLAPTPYSVIVTVAGSTKTSYSGDGDFAVKAGLSGVEAVWVDSLNDVYFTECTASVLRQVNLNSGIITLYAGIPNTKGFTDNMNRLSAKFNCPTALDSLGNIYVADSQNDRIRKLVAYTKTVTTVAGGSYVTSANNLPATSTLLRTPKRLWLDSQGNIYFLEYDGNVVRRINVYSGVAVIVAFTGLSGSSGDGGPALLAKTRAARAFYGDSIGRLFIGDQFNKRLRVRSFSTSSNIITTIAGSGSSGSSADNIPATMALLEAGTRIWVDCYHNLFISEYNSHQVRKVDLLSGLITTIAGLGTAAYDGDNGAAILASLNSPLGIASDTVGRLFIADARNYRVRMITAPFIPLPTSLPSGQPTSQPSRQPSRQPTSQPTRDPTGQPTSAPVGKTMSPTVNQPYSICGDTAGNIYIADVANSRIRLYSSSTKVIGTFAGTGTFSSGANNQLASSTSLAAPPVAQPTRQPTAQPTSQPTSLPTTHPFAFPSNQPTSRPSRQPTCEPTSLPTGEPSPQSGTSLPSGQPTSQPSRQPSPYAPQPVAQPTRQPTAQPTLVSSEKPSPLPSLISFTSQPVAAPLIYCSAISSQPLSSSARLSCTLNVESIYAGILYCVAYSLNNDRNQNLALLTNESTASSRIITTGTSVNFLPSQRNLSITLTGLTPLSPYLSDCAITLNDGRVSPFSDINAMQRRWNTTCCRTVLFIQHPIIIYEDINAYYDTSNFQSNYAFTFQLSSLPRSELIVQPQLLFSNSTMVDRKQYEISPASFQFTSTSALSTGSFVVLINGSIPESVYLLSLHLFGSSVNEYDTILPSVEVIIRHSTPLPPTLKQAILGDSGKDMYINFNSPTNQANYLVGQVFSCNELFNFSSSNLTPCYFLNSSSVRVILPFETNATLPQIQDGVVLLPKKIKAACASSISQDICWKYNFTSSAMTTIAAPFNPVIPNVIIIAPSIVGFCDNITLNTQQTSGLGGRPALFARWTVYSISGLTVTSDIENILNSHGVDCIRSFSFSRSLFGFKREDEFSVSLQITNWMGYTASSTVIIKASLQSTIPRLLIFDSRTKYMTTNQAFETFAKAYYSSCENKTKVLQYSWILTDTTITRDGTVLPIVSSSNDPTIYELPSYSLTPRHVYQLRLNVSIDGLNANENDLSTTVGSLSIIVNPGLLHAVILGGSRRSIPFNANVAIYGSASYDEDEPLSMSHLVYAWSCSIISLRFYGQQCNSIFTVPASDSADHVEVRGERLATNVTYSLQLRVSSADGRSSVDTVSVVRSPEYSALVSIASAKRQFNANANLTLDGSIEVNSSVIVKWEAFIEGKNYSFGSFTPLSLDLKQSYVVNSFVYSLIASASTFKPGTEITLRLTASVMVPVVSSLAMVRTKERIEGRQLQNYENQVISMTEILLIANGPATSGSMQVEPSTGLALSTDYYVQTSGWVDDPSNYPLTFAFYFRQFQSNQPALTLQSRSTSPTVFSDLTEGNPFYQYRMTVEVVVYNIHDAQDSVSAAVQVFPNPGLNITSYLTVHLTEAFARTDADLVFSTVNNVAETLNQINCTLASPLFCQGLHRNPCENQPQTCGSCLVGFEGVVGSANSLCFLTNATGPAPGKEGDPCRVNDDCLYGYCRSGMCMTPVLSCPSVYPNKTCSGHGRCGYFDLSGKEYKSPCLITDVYCKQSCVCDSEYGGRDCSLLSSDLKVRDGNRGTLCEAIVQITNMTRITTSL
eukprot:gene9198-9982_t